jgi:O-antigen ligase
MALLALVGALVLALLVNRTGLLARAWSGRDGRRGDGAAGDPAAALWTAEGGRALTVLTDPGETADIVFDPGDQPSYSPVRTRTHFWQLAIEMTIAHPMTGVGPFQWNFERYELGADEPAMVVDVHNTYLQVADEYGVLVLAVYIVLLALLLGRTLLPALRRTSPIAQRWGVTLLAMAAVLFPLTELTNSHFFNVRLGAFGWLLLAVAFAMATAIDAGQPAGEGLPAVESA